MWRRIDSCFSMVSPWAYIGHGLLQETVRRHRACIAHLPGAAFAAFALGCFGSPTHVPDGAIFRGQDRLELPDGMLESGRPPRQHRDVNVNRAWEVQRQCSAYQFAVARVSA